VTKLSSSILDVCLTRDTKAGMNEQGYKENIAESCFLPNIRSMVFALAKDFVYDFRVHCQNPGLCMFDCSVYSVGCVADKCFHKKETIEQPSLTE